MKYVKLARKIEIYFIGNISTKLLSAVMIVIYAFYINSESLGKYEYIQTLANIIVPIAFLSIWESILKYMLSTKLDNEKKQVINTSAIFSLIVTTVILIVGIIYYNFVKNEQLYIYIVLVYIFYGLSTVWQYYARCQNKTKIYVKSSVIGAFINLIAIVILICILKMDVKGLFIANIFSNFVILTFLECNLKIIKKINIKQFDTKLLKKMLVFSFPLVINDISLWLITGFGKTIIQNSLGASATGLYSFASKFTIVVNFLGIIINKALTEEMLVLEKNEATLQLEKILQQLIEKALIFLTLCIPIIMIFYVVIAKTEYYQSKIYVPMLLIYSFIMLISTNLSIVFKIAEKNKYQFITTLTGAIITIIISFLTIYKIGVTGVILGQSVGGLVNTILRYKISKDLINLKINLKKSFKVLIIYFIVSIISLKISFVQNVLLEIFLFTMILFIYKKDINKILNVAKNLIIK